MHTTFSPAVDSDPDETIRIAPTPPRWRDAGIAGGGRKDSALDPWSPVDAVGIMEVATTPGTSDSSVAGATVRFRRDSASTGDQISIEILLPIVTPVDLDLVATLEPGAGDNPAVPGVDFVDEPIPVTVHAGASPPGGTAPTAVTRPKAPTDALGLKLQLAERVVDDTEPLHLAEAVAACRDCRVLQFRNLPRSFTPTETITPETLKPGRSSPGSNTNRIASGPNVWLLLT